MKRRTYLTTATATTALAMAGCMSGGDGPDNESNESDDFGDFDDDDPSEEPPELAGTWDDFESLDEWTATKGSLEADTEQFTTGSQSVRISADDSANRGRIVKTLSSPLDCSEVVPGLAMASDVRSSPVIQLWDENGHKAQYRQQTAPENPFVRRNFGLSKMAGEVDLERIGEIHIVNWLGEDREGDLWVDDLFFAPRSQQGQVMLQFHGGYEAEYTEIFPVLDEYDVPATTFVPTGQIRESENADGDRLTTGQLDELAAAGWTVGSYGKRGLRSTDIDADQREAEVTEAASWLEEHGYEDGARFFAFPGGTFDETTYEAVTEQHDLAFAGRFPSMGHAANPHLCTRVMNPDPEMAGNLLEWTAEVGGITTIAFTAAGDGVAESLEAMATELPEYLDSEDLALLTPEQMADEFVF